MPSKMKPLVGLLALCFMSVDAFVRPYGGGESRRYRGSLKTTGATAGFRSRYWRDQEMKGIENITQREDPGSKVDKDSPRAFVRRVVYDTNQNIVGVEIGNAISDVQAKGVQSLAKSLREHASSQLCHRSFGEGMGGNDVTYLAPILQKLSPKTAHDVISLVATAYDAAGWTSHSHPRTLGIRTSEHLSYNGWKSLEAHKDVGSLYTIMIALKEPSDYEGGDFFLQTSFFEQETIKPDRLSAVVFLSDTVHGVRPISHGIRETFVTELWENDDAPLGMNRPTPEQWNAFVKRSGDQ